MVYNDDEYVMQWCDGTNWYGAGTSPYIPNAVYFDGATGLASNTVSGLTDSDSFIASFWVKPTSEAADFDVIFSGDSGAASRFHIALDNGASDTNDIWTIYAVGYNSSGATVFEYESAELLPTGVWSHVVMSLDASASTIDVYIDDVFDNTVTIFTPANGDVDFDTTRYNVGEFADNSSRLSASLSDLWFESGIYFDLSDVNIRRQFIDANGFPVDLGSDGSRPTGSAPDLFLSGDTATWHTNDGTGGGFTETGALSDALTNPGENLGPTNGLVAWYKLDGTSGAAWTDSSPSGNDTTVQFNGSQPRANGVINRYHNLTEPDRQNTNSATTLATMGNMPDLTVSFWGRPYGSDGFNILVGSNDIFGIVNRGFAPPNTTGQMSFRANAWSGNNGNFYLSSSVGYGNNFNKWTHYAITYSYNDPVGTLPIWYINNVPVTVNTWTAPTGVFTPAASGTLYFGRNGGSSSSGWEGDLDDFRIYNRVLSPAEIEELYETGLACRNPDGFRDGDMTYNTTHHVPQYCNLREWKAMAPAPGDGGSCPNIGDVCTDGSVYAGVSPDGNANMYATAADSGTFAWNNGNSTGQTSVSGAADDDAGMANTIALVSADSDSITAGVQPHLAAQHCYDLVIHGKDDWYLPSINESGVLRAARNTGSFSGTFTTGGYPGGEYATSTEINNTQFRRRSFDDGGNYVTMKDNSIYVRCVRKGGTTGDCTNPAGDEGDIMYNSTSNVMQYCEGDEWKAMWKW